MQTAIHFSGGELEVTLNGDTWTVRLGELEESSIYLDYALARLLDVPTPEVHQLAIRIIQTIPVDSAPQPAAAVSPA